MGSWNSSKDSRDDLINDLTRYWPKYLEELKGYAENVVSLVEEKEKEIEKLEKKIEELEEEHAKNIEELKEQMNALQDKVSHYESLPEIRGYVVATKLGIT